ncbi:hypothetical protein FHX74_002664 [Friedmanniella endophytica]|uniref:Uncharacterized protein n=1 Tax=Microlunatus kandeliicorticis TaxID=1759536 RepID=A0A7W3ITN9_9ACTN|nr:hypothetical protein [Microlunatus kandeliicorticis]
MYPRTIRPRTRFTGVRPPAHPTLRPEAIR